MADEPIIVNELEETATDPKDASNDSLWVSFKRSFKKLPFGTALKYTFVVVGVVGVVIVAGWLANSYTYTRGGDFIKEFEIANANNKCEVVKDDGELIAQINRQRIEIIARANNHRNVALFFFGKFYATVLAFSIAAAIATISLAIIAKKGIEEANNYIILAFFTATALAVFYQGFSDVFQQKNNIEQNQKLYVQYVNLKDEIDAYCSTGEVVIKDPKPFLDTLAETVKVDATTPINDKVKSKADKKAPTLGSVQFSVPVDAKKFVNYIHYQMKLINIIAVRVDDSKAFDESRLTEGISIP